MSDIEQLKSAIHDSNELWKLGEYEKALKLLDDSIAGAVKQKRSSWVRTLSHHAAVIASSASDLGRVRDYYEQSLAHDPENPRALYGLASVSLEQGETDKAKRYATKCYKAILRSDDEIDKSLLELIAKQWPELGVAG